MSTISPETSGVFVIAVTPFTDDGAIDLASIDRMVDFYFEKGADGLTILGIMGEAPKLDPDGGDRRHRAGPRPRRRPVPVVVGVSAPGFAAIGELTEAVMDLGAAGVMVAPPSTLRTDDQIVAYYRNVVETIGADVPVRPAGLPAGHRRPDQPKRSAHLRGPPEHRHAEARGLAGPRQDHRPPRRRADGRRRRISILSAMAVLPARGDAARRRRRDDRLRLSRDDGRRLPPQAAGDHERAHDLFDAYLPLVRYEQQPGLGLAVRKYVLAKRGAINSAVQRRPAAGLHVEAVAEIEVLLERQGLRLKQIG